MKKLLAALVATLFAAGVAVAQDTKAEAKKDEKAAAATKADAKKEDKAAAKKDEKKDEKKAEAKK